MCKLCKIHTTHKQSMKTWQHLTHAYRNTSPIVKHTAQTLTCKAPETNEVLKPLRSDRHRSQGIDHVSGDDASGDAE